MAEKKQTPGFITWTDESSKQDAFNSASEGIDLYEGIQRTAAFSYRSFLDIETNRSVRTGMGRQDYDRFRSDEAVPKKQKDIMRMCMDAYSKVGIIRNVIDLMGDFSSQGVTVVHPNKKIESFYKKWFAKVGGPERSERFLNTLYRCGNVVVKRRTAKISKRIEENFRKSQGADIDIESLTVKKREIPWKYDFLNPLSVEVLGGQLAIFAGEPEYALKVSSSLRNMYKRNVPNYQSVISRLPTDLASQMGKGVEMIPLDKEKLRVFHYKKDDWNIWANPMIYAILDDIIMLEKMKLADIAALDGAISNIRLWKLGDLDNKILPTKSAINKLRNILASNVGGGTMDLVWGPELDFKESNTQVFKFLGSEKYDPVLNSIYAGLGVPPTLTGLANNGGGFTNNFISLKTLVERLEYGRSLLIDFWQEEIERVQKAMGFRFPAKVHFDQMVLSDEAAEKNLLIQLVDRDLISGETVQERFGEIPEIERIRIKREHQNRVREKSPPKASPYHNPQHRQDLEKIALTKDALSPHDLGLRPSDESGPHPLTNPDDRSEFDEEEEFKKMERKQQIMKPSQKEFTPKGRPEDGRPKNSKDKTQRKQKVVKTRQAASDLANLMLWASSVQKDISDVLNPALLHSYGKSNLRGLTKAQMDELEYIKLCILSNIKPYSTVDAELLASILEAGTPADKQMLEVYKQLTVDFAVANDRNPNIEEKRSLQSSAYALRFTEA
tara:strand:- start:4020 stop:6197 length:2178 start_codon:yes stop_codon:yes gene_type:complete